MKKRVSCVLLLVGVVICAFLSTDANSQTKDQPIILKAVTFYPKSNMAMDPVHLFVESVNKRAQGRLRIEWLGGPEVFAAFDQVHALKGGTIDMILYIAQSYMKSVMPEADAKGLSELTEWEERKSGAFELWSEIFEKRVNAKYLGRFHSNLKFYIYTNWKVDKVADFKGRNIRTMPLYIPFIKALGANPITIPPTDIYTSLERGVVDGFMFSKIGMTSFGFQEVIKYIIEPGVFQIEPVTVMNLDRWKKIPKDLQELLMDVMKDHEYIASMRSLMIEEKEDRVMEKGGMKITKLPPEEAAKYIKIAYDTTWEQIIKTAAEYGPKLRKAMSREAVPKGAFPW